MARERFDSQYRSTVPDDLQDPPRFAQVLETTKDAFVLNMRTFFDQQQVPGRLQELPTVEKYETGFESPDEPFLTTVEIIQEYPDILETLPHVSVTAQGGSNRRMTVGVPYIATVQYPPRVEGSADGPYDLSPGGLQLVLRTQPQRSGVWVEETIVFRSSRFADVSAAPVQDVVRVINERALYVQAFVTPENTVGIQCGGKVGGDRRPNAIEILAGTSPGVLSALGLSIGQSDNSFNAARPPSHRYHMASQVQVAVDIITVDVNTRRELTDLIYSWALFWAGRDFFELQGRSWQEEGLDPEEWYHISLHQEVSVSGHREVPRPNDAKDKVHIQRVTIPCTTWQYIDRQVFFQNVTPDQNFILQGSNFVQEGLGQPQSRGVTAPGWTSSTVVPSTALIST